MPYLKQSDRQWFVIPVEVLRSITRSGHLNYIFTKVILAYLDNMGTSYATYNDVIGALEACKLELYRRKIADYENVKISENGDAY